MDEKTSLIEEVNHRVKNNLAAVSALVDLKRLSLGTSVDLSDISAHIGAIRFVYEQLSHSRDADEVDLVEYVGRLLESVFKALPDVRTELEIPLVQVSARPWDSDLWMPLLNNLAALWR